MADKLTAPLFSADGAEKGTVELNEAIFGIEPNVAVMHQVVTAQLAAKRAGTHSTKTRAEVRGGGAPSRGARRASAALATDRSAPRSGSAVAWHTAPSRVTTASAHPRR